MSNNTKTKSKTNVNNNNDSTKATSSQPLSLNEWKKQMNTLLAKASATQTKRTALQEFLSLLSTIDSQLASELNIDTIPYRTFDYKRFKKVKGNRTIKPSKIRRLYQSITKGLNLLPYCPILVNKEYHIYDGQHRFETAKANGWPIYFIICEEMSKPLQIAEMNANADSWNMRNYLDLHVSRESKEYIFFEKFVDKHNLGISTALALLDGKHVCAGGYGGATRKKFCTGDMSIKSSNKTFAQKVMSHVQDFKEYDNAEVSFTNSRDFVMAVATVTKLEEEETYSHDKMMKKMKKAASSIFVPCVDAKEYLRMLEAVYNHGMMNHNHTRFF